MDYFLILLGYIGGLLSVIGLLPQLIKIITTKETKDLSLLTFFIFVISQLSWTIYGFIKLDYTLMICSFICLVLNLLITIFIYNYNYNYQECYNEYTQLNDEIV